MVSSSLFTNTSAYIGKWSYDSALFGPSGNITVNGSMSCVPETARTADFTINKRGLGAGQEKGVDLNTPPYAIHNGKSNSICDMVDANINRFWSFIYKHTCYQRVPCWRSGWTGRPQSLGDDGRKGYPYSPTRYSSGEKTVYHQPFYFPLVRPVDGSLGMSVLSRGSFVIHHDTDGCFQVGW